MSATHPPVCWAQRKDVVLLTVPLQDAEGVSLVVTDKLSLQCTVADKLYKCEIPLFDEVVAEESSHVVRPRQIEIKLQKKKKGGEFWPRLTKDKTKNSCIQVDWQRWKDEDDTGAAAEDDLGEFGQSADVQRMIAEMSEKAKDPSAAKATPGDPVGATDPHAHHAHGEKDADSDDEMPPLEEEGKKP